MTTLEILDRLQGDALKAVSYTHLNREGSPERFSRS